MAAQMNNNATSRPRERMAVQDFFMETALNVTLAPADGKRDWVR